MYSSAHGAALTSWCDEPENERDTVKHGRNAKVPPAWCCTPTELPYGHCVAGARQINLLHRNAIALPAWT